MKKILKMFLILGFLITMPMINASLVSNVESEKKDSINFNKHLISDEDKPGWAEGKIIGTWGLREFFLFNMIERYWGNISAYYKAIIGPIKMFKGTLISRFNESKTTNISGIFFRNIVYGKIGDINIESEEYNVETNETNYVGIGTQNDTEFDWRIMSSSGPTFYLKGEFSIIK